MRTPLLPSPRKLIPLIVTLVATLGSGLIPAPLTVARAADATTTFHVFNGSDGDVPTTGLAQGSDGNFYGTTAGTGYNGDDGTVFQITPAGALTTLYRFNGTDGSQPSGLVQGRDGNFYGTTKGGGDEGAGTTGTAFQLTLAGQLTILHRFAPAEGIEPTTGLIQGADGNFYGTTINGGDYGLGIIYQLTPAGAFTTLHSFYDNDGDTPSGLVQDADGNFYGTTRVGGTAGKGIVFKITPGGAYTVLHEFSNVYVEGSDPLAGLSVSRDGDLYGTTSQLGPSQSGTIFRLTPDGTLTVLHAFTGDDGSYALAALVQGSDGNFYGTTYDGGAHDRGTIFQITPDGAFTSLYSFGGTDGDGPAAPLAQGSDGNFYGTTDYGGPGYTGLSAQGQGTVFKLTPVPSFFNGQTALDEGVYYLSFASGHPFGYYAFLADANYIYHFDLGYEYVFDADDGNSGVYLYDFASTDFFYTGPEFPFPYLYDFDLGSVVYYYPDPSNAGHYNTDGVRYFYVFSTGKIISK